MQRLKGGKNATSPDVEANPIKESAIRRSHNREVKSNAI